jgi:hypothetical protein
MLAYAAGGNYGIVCTALVGDHENLFAGNSNKLTKRFSSRTDKQDSEDVDAFTVQFRNQSESGCFHRETAFVFLQVGQERRVAPL